MLFQLYMPKSLTSGLGRVQGSHSDVQGGDQESQGTGGAEFGKGWKEEQEGIL